MADLRARLAALPKPELHVHLRGAMPLETFDALTAQYPSLDVTQLARPGLVDAWRARANIAPFLEPGAKSLDEVRRLFDYPDFTTFILTFALTGFWIRTPEDFRRLVDDVLASLAAQRIVYAEITVSVREYVLQGVPLEALLATLDEAAATAPLRVRWIMDLVRDFGAQAGEELLEAVLAYGCRSLVGITIGGSEHQCPPAPFQRAFERAREAGLRLTAHAGEAAGPASVWDALRLLGVERLGHGVRAIEDPALVRYLAEHRIPLEVCPTSNLMTRLYPSYAEHAVHALHAAGVPVTVSTDDPTFFHTALADELAHLHAAGMSEATIRELVANGYRYAFAEEAVKAELLRQFEEAWPAERESAP